MSYFKKFLKCHIVCVFTVFGVCASSHVQVMGFCWHDYAGEIENTNFYFEFYMWSLTTQIGTIVQKEVPMLATNKFGANSLLRHHFQIAGL